MNFVDTSVWIEFFRARGNARVQGRLQSLILAGEVAITEWVILELMAGIRSNETSAQVLARIQRVHRLSILDGTWERTWDLAARLRKRGMSPNAADCLVAAIAMDHKATLIHCDTDFEAMTKYEKELLTEDWTHLS